MSLFERDAARRLIVKGSSTRNGNQNSSNQNNGNNRSRQHNSGKSAKQRKDNNRGSSLRRFGGDNTDRSNNNNDYVNTVESVNEVLSDFVNNIQKNIDKPSEIKEIIEDSFEDVAAAMRYYYDERMEECLPVMNKVLDIMTTNQFANILLGVLKQDPFDNWDDMWKDVALLISILLETSSNKMKEGTIQIYVNDILAGNGMWKTEIDQMVDTIGITEDLAIELVIGLPVKAEDMTDLLMRSTYQSFLNAILTNAEDNIEILNNQAQRKLFDFFFNENGKSGKLASKVIGRYLADEDLDGLTSVESLIYGEFKQMLLEKLDSYDVNNIAFVIRYIVDQKKHGVKNTMFDVTKASEYDTIRKAIVQVISNDESAKEYLM